MGGETIRDILERGKAHLSGHERLILQPNGGEQPLRQWLMDNAYRIVCEEVLRENRFDYEIIVAERDEPVAYTEQELYFGPLQMQARSPAFLVKWQRPCGAGRARREGAGRRTAGPLDHRTAGLNPGPALNVMKRIDR
jgi:tRNA (adenine22-N1)-methyltransferase